MGTKEIVSQDYNMWASTTYLQSQTATTFKWTRIKGHPAKKKDTKPTIDVIIHHHTGVKTGKAREKSITQPRHISRKDLMG